MPKFRNIYSHREEVKTGITFDLPSRTKQEFESESNINTIMNKYALGYPLPEVSNPIYEDVSEIPTDYLEAQQKVLDAQEKFNNLPSDLRKRFDFNPSKMLEFISNPNNFEEGVKLGLFRDTHRSDSFGNVDSVRPNLDNGSINQEYSE